MSNCNVIGRFTSPSPLSTPPHLPGKDQLYQYTADLLCLNFHSPREQAPVPNWLGHFRPLPGSMLWATTRMGHSGDRGFRVGFKYGSPLKSAGANMMSASQHPEVFQEYLENELSRGRMLGPFPTTHTYPHLQVNRVGIIPKGHNSGKWRLITDLSFPPDQSVNDGIDPMFRLHPHKQHSPSYLNCFIYIIST